MMRRVRVQRTTDPTRASSKPVELVVLCSLTTTLGCTALLSSLRRASRSFLTDAAVDEITRVVADVLVLPSLLCWRRRRRVQRACAEQPS